MKRSSMFVTRVNKDVIATSTKLCSAHPDKEHEYLYSVTGYEYAYYFAEGSVDGIYGNYTGMGYHPNAAVGKWYYYDYDAVLGYSTPRECNGDHSSYKFPE